MDKLFGIFLVRADTASVANFLYNIVSYNTEACYHVLNYNSTNYYKDIHPRTSIPAINSNILLLFYYLFLLLFYICLLYYLFILLIGSRHRKEGSWQNVYVNRVYVFRYYIIIVCIRH
jgi:hypothetical protein